jgi:hypothetical protein
MESLVFVLQKRCVSALKREFVDDEIWIENFRTMLHALGSLENHKFLQPKFTQCLPDIAAYIGEELKSVTTPKSSVRARSKMQG